MKIYKSGLSNTADIEFRQWLKNNQDGFYIQCTTSSRFKLHRATCKHLGFDNVDVDLTQKQKVGSTKRAELEEWAFLNSDEELHTCNDCLKEPLTLFSWGYWGWGNATQQLVQMVSAVEQDRGYKPALFVDIRFSRTVRAVGFRQKAFGETCGESHYVWMKSLGNKAIGQPSGANMEINNPGAVADLFSEAVAHANKKERLLFFCACEYPLNPDKEPHKCHRTLVSILLLDEARKRGISMQIVEWPGRLPFVFEVPVTVNNFDKLRHGNKSIPLGNTPVLEKYGAIPWGSIARIRKEAREDFLLAVTGPAHFSGEWWLPLPYGVVNQKMSLAELKPRAWKWREKHGFAVHEVYA
jgi:hypothetical protein